MLFSYNNYTKLNMGCCGGGAANDQGRGGGPAGPPIEK